MFGGAALRYRAGCWGGRGQRGGGAGGIAALPFIFGSSATPVPEALRPRSRMQDRFPLSKKRLQTPNEPGRKMEDVGSVEIQEFCSHSETRNRSG